MVYRFNVFSFSSPKVDFIAYISLQLMINHDGEILKLIWGWLISRGKSDVHRCQKSFDVINEFISVKLLSQLCCL